MSDTTNQPSLDNNFNPDNTSIAETIAASPHSYIGPVEPPTRLWSILQQLGPGLIIAGSIVGSGELISTTKTGAQSGMTLLWLILFGCVIKVFVQVEIGRHTITHGETSLYALNRLPGKVGKINWILWTWLAMMLVSVFQLGGIVGGVGQALAIARPITGDYIRAIGIPSDTELKFYHKWEPAIEQQSPQFTKLNEADQVRIKRGLERITFDIEKAGDRAQAALEKIRAGGKNKEPYTFDEKIWAGFLTALTVYLLIYSRYTLIQNLTTVLVVTFTLITIGNVISLQFFPQWALSSAEIWHGLTFHLPRSLNEANPVITALNAFGVIGVGAAELIQYPYWCLEKGYGKHIGPREETVAWENRARGWMRVMTIDAFFSLVIYTLATIAFLILGATVLYRDGHDPDGMRMVSTLAQAYIPIFGAYAWWLFLIGAVAVLYSTFLVANAGHARTWADFFGMIGWTKADNEEQLHRQIGMWGAIMSTLCFLMLLTGLNPVKVVLLAGMMQALLLPMIGIGALVFRYQLIDPRLRPSKLWDCCLILSVLSFAFIASWTLYIKGSEFAASLKPANKVVVAPQLDVDHVGGAVQ
jgi:Mn2+/Fe2+ NRAMP family transporter